MKPALPLLAPALLLLATHAAAGPDDDLLRATRLAAICNPCHALHDHGTAGRKAPAARPDSAWLQERLLAYREQRHPATLMHQVAVAYSREELELIARHWAQSRR